MNFHLPYHFVPFMGTGATPPADRTHVTHGNYAPATHSGRIVCRIKTETPIFVGGHRHADSSPARVEPYRLHNQLAIPGSSLRGMVGSLIEAASNSAFRVLNTKARYSVRKTMDPKETLSAIGMVLQGEGGFELQPLTIPTLRAERDGSVALPKKFWKLFPEPNLKVYVGGASQIRRDTFAYRTFRQDEPVWWAMPLKKRAWLDGFRLWDDEFQHRRPANRSYLLAQLPLDHGCEPITYEKLLNSVKEEQRSRWVLGAMRVLGCWGNRDESMPPGKKHELFIPFPSNPPVVPIRQSVVDTFEELCDARTAASKQGHERDPIHRPLLPFEPRDTRAREGTGDKERKLRLQVGDLVYFGVDDGGQVNEISFSAIWREKKEPAGAFFPKELWPYDGKRALSDAELLLGYVEDRDKDPHREEQAKALASRVRFASALLVPKPGAPAQLPEVPLRVLDSPKPPCPSLYFKPKSQTEGGFISKHALNSVLHQAQGRKFYLHQRPAEQEQWVSRSPKANKEQLTLVAPIDRGQEFYFHIDFDNLSERELGLLFYSLSPSSEFRHKIGMGKALGLGSIHVEPLAYLRVRRDLRYTPQGHGSPRYHEVYADSDARIDSWPAAYGVEREAMAQAPAGTWERFRDGWRQTMNQQIRRSIELVGEPRHVKAEILPPLIDGQTDKESETFKWFVANENGLTSAGRDEYIPPQKQFLRPLVGLNDLPVLPQPRWQRKP